MSAPALPSRRQCAVGIYGGDVPTLLRRHDGSIIINPDKVVVKRCWHAATLNGAYPFTVPSSSTGGNVVANVTIGAQDGADVGDFEVSTILSTALDGSNNTGRIAIQPTVVTPMITQALSNDFVPTRLMSGTAQLPGLLPASIYNLPKSSWNLAVKNLETSNLNVSTVLYGRRFTACSPEHLLKLRKRAQFLRFAHPYWIVPADPSNSSLSGPEITLAPNASVPITFPTKTNSDFLMLAMLDDSNAVGGGGDPSLFAQVSENISGRGFVDLPPSTNVSSGPSTALGVSWRDFLAVPSANVTGFPGDGWIRAFSLWGGPSCRFTHLVRRDSEIVIRFTSLEASRTIKLRVCLFGLCIYPEMLGDGGEEASSFLELLQQGRDYTSWWEG